MGQTRVIKQPTRRIAGRILLGVFAAAALLGSSACSQADPRERIRVTAVTVPGTPWHQMWVDFAASARRDWPESLEVELYVLAQLGPEQNMIANLRRNRMQMAGLSLQGAAQVVPELNILLAPYLFDSQEELDFILDQYLLEPYSRLLEEKNLTIVQWADVGWTHLYARQPLLSPTDFKGRRMRTSRAAGARAFGRAIGMNQIVLPFTEVIPALQTGLIDGGQSGVGMYALAGVAREAPHLILTAHAYDAGLIVANADWWQGLDHSVRAQVRAALDPVDKTRRDVRQMIAGIQAGITAGDSVFVHPLDAETRREWQRVSVPAQAELIAEIGGQSAAIHAQILAGKQAFRQIQAR